MIVFLSISFYLLSLFQLFQIFVNIPIGTNLFSNHPRHDSSKISPEMSFEESPSVFIIALSFHFGKTESDSWKYLFSRDGNPFEDD